MELHEEKIKYKRKWARRVGIFLFCLSLLNGGYFFYFGSSLNLPQPADETPGTGPISPEGRVEFERGRIAHYQTGKVPPGGVWKAFKERRKQQNLPVRPAVKSRPHKKADTGWSPINDFFTTLSVTQLAYDPNNPDIMYFCTGEGWRNADAVRGAGVWRSLDGGQTWEQLPATDNTDFYWCQDILVHPQTSDIYVATRNKGILRSTDTGNTWQQVLGRTGITSTNEAADLELTKKNGLFATFGMQFSDGIYYSETGDKGTWTQRLDGQTFNVERIELATAPSHDSIVYFTAVNYSNYIKGFYKSIDQGNNWFEISIPGGDSTDFAHSQGWYDLILQVAPHDPGVVVAGGIDLWRTMDGGQSWQRLSNGHNLVGGGTYQYVHVDQHEVMFQSPDTVYFGNDGGIWRTTNFTDSMPDIINLNRGYNVTQYYTTDIHPHSQSPRLLGGTQDNGSHLAVDSGVAPFERVSGADGAYCAFDYDQPDTFYTSKQYEGVYRHLHGGDSGKQNLTNPYLGDDDVMFINPLEMDPNNPELLYMASKHGLWRLKNASTANRSDWQRGSQHIGIVGGDTVEISAIGITKNVKNVVFLGRRLFSGSSANVNLYRLKFAHISSPSKEPEDIDPSNTLPYGNIIHTSCIEVNPDDGNHVIVTFSNYGLTSIYQSTNALANQDSVKWQPVEGNLPDIPVYWAQLHPTDSTVCYIATGLGVYYTPNLQGDSTVWKSTGLANVRTDMLSYRPSDQTIVAATHGRGMFTGTIDTTGGSYDIEWNERGPTNVGGRTRTFMLDPSDTSNRTLWAGSVSGGLWKINNVETLTPKPPPPPDTPEINYYDFSYKLYPNPASGGEVTFQYTLPYETSVTLRLYDLSGRLMGTLVDETQEKGPRQIEWSINNSLPPGLYLARLQYGFQSKTLKFYYLK